VEKLNNKIILSRVTFIPRQLEQGILYFSDEFSIAAHLCPCGCGNKVFTPISPIDWSFYEDNGEPNLSPSVGNWQLPCQSHYWIEHGQIIWSNKWTPEAIIAARRAEEKRRKKYFKRLRRKRIIEKFLKYFGNLFNTSK